LLFRYSLVGSAGEIWLEMVIAGMPANNQSAQTVEKTVKNGPL